MKATNPFKFYADDDAAKQIRRKCAQAGLSVSRAAVEAILNHWQPKRNAVRGVPYMPIRRPMRPVGLPGRACLRL